jgi:hypothetical protein
MHQQETDRRIRSIWELCLEMELGQLHVACDFLRRYEGLDPAEILPAELPEVPLTFEPNKDHVRQVLDGQVDLRLDGLGYTPVDELDDGHRFFEFQETVNAGGVPSEQVIDRNRSANGREYRDETEGEHPAHPMPDQIPAHSRGGVR